MLPLPVVMQNPALFSRTHAIGIALSFLLACQPELRAEAGPEVPPVKPATAIHDDAAQAELLKSYLQVREQLHAAELAIANNRLESEATARAQSAAITEKLNLIESKIAAESARQREDALRSVEQQEISLAAVHETNRRVLRISVAIGGIGLLTMLSTSLFQWRGIRRMEKVATQLQQLPMLVQPGSLPAGNLGASGDSVTHGNQRLMSVIDRMEQRIHELEQTTEPPFDAATGEAVSDAHHPRNATAAGAQAARIAVLLGEGRALLNATKACEVIACYDEILTLDANHAEALVKKGAALERLKQDHDAIACYDHAIQADPNMALAYLSKGGIFNRLQRFDEAVQCYEQALRVEKAGEQNGATRVSVSGDWPAANAGARPV